MTVDLAEPRFTSAPQRGTRRLWLGLLAICLAFLLWRGPVMYREAGGMDEYYAVPGLTVLEDGLPRFPHVPAQNPESVFYRSDVLLFSEPPLSFYYQALFYAVLPDIYGTCRLSSAVAGFGVFVLLAQLGRQSGLSVRAMLWGVGLYSLSRWYFFLAIAGRPDVLCTMFGMAACLSASRWEVTKDRRWLVAAGLAIGSGGLTHPFAIVYALQIGAWVLLAARGWHRLIAPTIVTVVSLATASLWLILILQQPEIFEVQFRNQFLSGDGAILSRLLWPWDSLAYHFRLQSERTRLLQFTLAALGWLALGIAGWHRGCLGVRRLWWLTTTAVWLIAALIGTHHPVFGYWTYPASMAFLGVGLVVDRVMQAVRQPIWSWVCGLVIVALMLPGSGLRTLMTHMQHWNDINYNAPQFGQRLLSQLPKDAVYMVDEEYALDFIAAKRTTLMPNTLSSYIRSELFDYDYLIVGRTQLGMGIVEFLDAEFVESRGVKDDLLACYVEIYRPKRKLPANDAVK